MNAEIKKTPFWPVESKIYLNDFEFSVNAVHRRTPCVLTPPSTPINSDLSTLNMGNNLPSHLYSQNGYRGTATSNEFTTEKVSPMHYSSNTYGGHQTTAVDIYTNLYNDYTSCGQASTSTDYNNELTTMEMPSVYNVNGYTGFESHKYNGEHSAYFDSEKKYDISGVDSSRNICTVQNGYMHYNNCWSNEKWNNQHHQH